MCDRYVEAVNAAVKRVYETRQPRLELLSLPAFLHTHPVRQLRDDDRARVAAILLRLEPRNHLRLALLLRRLADDVGVEQPAHNFRRLASPRRLGGTSSGLTGHSFITESQLSRPPRRRNTIASSSASKCASK